MVKMIVKLKMVVMLVCLSVATSLNAQYSIGGGLSTIFQFGNNKPFVGGHIIAEIPQNDDVTFYGRLCYTTPQKQSLNRYEIYDPATNNFYPLTEIEKFNYLSIDGGTRYYLINGFDESISIYGGTNIGVFVNTVRKDYDFDDGEDHTDLLDAVNLQRGKGTVLSIAVGVSGGVKYTMPGRGTLYFDINPHMMLFGVGSNNVANSTQTYRQLVFNFGIGYRREFY